MSVWRLKIVPNHEPNATGKWVSRQLREKPTYDTVLPDFPDHHIVQIQEERIGPVDQPPTQLIGMLGRAPRC